MQRKRNKLSRAEGAGAEEPPTEAEEPPAEVVEGAEEAEGVGEAEGGGTNEEMNPPKIDPTMRKGMEARTTIPLTRRQHHPSEDPTTQPYSTHSPPQSSILLKSCGERF
jgi:hypothetical protein